MNAAAYYGDEAVRGRILEFLGAAGGRAPTAAFVAVFEPQGTACPTWDNATRIGTRGELPWADGRDLSRSLWDTAQLIFFIELDYQNADRPEESFRHPADMLVSLEPTFLAAHRVLAAFGLRTATYASGRGYHFAGAIPLDDPIVDDLAARVPETPRWWSGHHARRPPGVTAVMTERHARAADGLGLLIEHSAHLMLRQARRSSPLPVVLNGTIVGSGLNGRTAVSIDFSHVGDPLDARHVRAAFSTYQWHRNRPDIFGEAVARNVAPLAVVPRPAIGLTGLLGQGRSLEAGLAAARTATAALPDVTNGIRALAAHYDSSPLAAFHRRFLAGVRASFRTPPDLTLPLLPGCVEWPLASPNDLLLQPAPLQHLTRMLLARGWDAPRIAALVAAAYEADHGWGDRWTRLDAPTRAAFDVRVFAGMVETGLDTLVDFNCVSAQEKDLCPRTRCDHNLEWDRDGLRARWSA